MAFTSFMLSLVLVFQCVTKYFVVGQARASTLKDEHRKYIMVFVAKCVVYDIGFEIVIVVIQIVLATILEVQGLKTLS